VRLPTLSTSDSFPFERSSESGTTKLVTVCVSPETHAVVKQVRDKMLSEVVNR
ncbi:uncharacterized protein METZ01_LOCUS276854, partial [marine metagenome]